MPDQKDTLDATRGDSFGWLAMMGGMPVFGARLIPIFRRIYNPGNSMVLLCIAASVRSANL